MPVRLQRAPAPAAGPAADDVALPRPRWADAAACAAIALLVLFAFGEVAFGGRTLTTSIGVPGVSGDDPPPGYGPVDVSDLVRPDRGASAWQFEPWAEVVHRELTRGEVPLWNPYQGSGTPLAANMQSAVFDPLLLAVHLHPTPRTWDLTFLALFVLGGVATYAFGRMLGLGAAASLTGAAAFVLSGFFFVRSNNQYVRVYLYLPVLLACVEGVLRSRRLVPVGALGLGIALTILAGMPEPSFFVLATAGAYGAWRLVRGPRTAGRAASALRLAAGAALGVAVTAPLLLPFLEYQALSFNLHSPSTGLAADSARFAVNWVVPYVNGLAQQTSQAGTGSWVGMAVPVLGAVALTGRAAMRRHHGWFFAGLAAVVLLKQFGVAAVQWIGTLPVANLAVFPIFSLPLAAFGLAMLAAVGVQAVADGSVHRARLAVGLAVLLPGVVLLTRLDAGGLQRAGGWYLPGQYGIALAGALLVVLAAAGLPRRVAGLGTAAVIGAEALLLARVPLGLDPWRVGVLAAAGAVALGAAFVRRTPRPAALLALLAVAAELLVLVPRGIYARLWDPYLEPAWMRLVAGGEDRVFGLQGKLYPDTAGVFGIHDVRSLDALYVRRYVEFVKTFVEPDFDDRWTGRVAADESTPPNVDANPMWDLLGVRWLLTGASDALSPFVARVLAATEPSEDLQAVSVDLGGDRRPALVARGGREVRYPVYEGDARTLTFAYGLPPGAAPGGSLSVAAVAGDSEVPLWRAAVPPGDPSGAWTPVFLDLPQGPGRLSALVLRSEGLPAGAAWTGLEVHGAAAPGSEGRYRPAGSAAGVQVVEDRGRLPRAFVVHRARRVATQAEAVAELGRAGARFADGAVRVEGFDPRTEAVVEAQPGELPSFGTGPGAAPAVAERVRIVSYEPGRVVLQATTSRPGLLVLTDVFFPGWKATVDGRAAPVLPADVAFRGVPVGAGTSTVVVSYRPRSFTLGLGLAGAAVLAAGAAMALRRRRLRATPAP